MLFDFGALAISAEAKVKISFRDEIKDPNKWK
jgi:hypothetical protein